MAKIKRCSFLPHSVYTQYCTVVAEMCDMKVTRARTWAQLNNAFKHMHRFTPLIHHVTMLLDFVAYF